MRTWAVEHNVASLESRLSVPDFVSQLWRKKFSPKLLSVLDFVSQLWRNNFRRALVRGYNMATHLFCCTLAEKARQRLVL